MSYFTWHNPPRRSRRSLVAASVISLGLVLAACGGDDAADTDRPASADATDNDAQDSARHIAVTADSFTFEPNEIVVTAGEAVTIELTAGDMLHDLVIDEFDVQLEAETGETVEGGLQADTPGEYTFYCSIPGHREAGMEGTLIVEEA